MQSMQRESDSAPMLGAFSSINTRVRQHPETLIKLMFCYVEKAME